MQGTIMMFDPATREGIVVRDTDRTEIVLAENALQGSIFRMLRQGQRIVFDVDEQDLAVRVRAGSEADMGTPGFPQPHEDSAQHPQGGTEG